MAELLNKLDDGQAFVLLLIVIGLMAVSLWVLFEAAANALRSRRRRVSRAALRDKFAAHAMAALIVHDHSPERDGFEALTITDICTDAYRYADQMMIERKADQEFNRMLGVDGVVFGSNAKGGTNGTPRKDSFNGDPETLSKPPKDRHTHPLCSYPSCACGVGCQHKEVRNG